MGGGKEGQRCSGRDDLKRKTILGERRHKAERQSRTREQKPEGDRKGAGILTESSPETLRKTSGGGGHGQTQVGELQILGRMSQKEVGRHGEYGCGAQIGG